MNRKSFLSGLRSRLFYSLRSRLLFMTSIVVLFSMTLTSWSTLRVMKKHLVEDMQHQLHSSLSIAVLSYDHEVSRVKQAVATFALSNAVKTSLRLGSFGQLRGELEHAASLHGLDFLLITDGMGDLQVSPFADHLPDRDFYNHPVLFEAMIQRKYGGTVLEENSSLLYMLKQGRKDITGAPMVVIEAAAPIAVRDRVVGYVLGGVPATGNEKMFNEFSRSAGCREVILVAGNRIAAVGSREGKALRRGGRFPVPLDYRNDSRGGHRELRMTVAGVHEVYDFRVLEMPDQKSMVALACTFSQSRFYHLLAGFRRSMILAFVLTLVTALLLAALLSGSIARPLHRLTRVMGQVGKKGTYATLPVRRKDEIGALLAGYNRMASTINERIRQLSEEVRQRKKAEQRLAAESERLQVTLQSIADAVLAVDPQGRIVLMNRVAGKMSGLNPEEAVGMPLDELFSIRSLRTGKVVEDLPAAILEQGQEQITAGDLLLSCRDGREIQVTESCAPLTDNRGRVIGVVIALRDVTEQRRMEEELARGIRLESVGILAGGIAHDFNNLLTAILGNLSLARMDAADASRQQKNIDGAEQAALRARDLTLQLLTFSKGGEPVRRSENIAELIRESAVFIARGSRAHLQFTMAPDLWPAVIDRGQVSQVVENLVINGIQAMADGGILSIRVDNRVCTERAPVPVAPGRYIRVEVADQGEGIAEDILDRIFDPYFTTKEAGNGLGLSICYSIVSKHGGYIGICRHSGPGAVFEVYLPAGEPEREQMDDKNPARAELRQGAGRILVMDDQEMVRTVLKAMLDTLGYEAVCVADGAAAVSTYRKAMGTPDQFSCVFLDVTIPGGMGAEEVVAELRRLDPSLKAIVSSGHSRHGVLMEYPKHGFDGVAVKPYRLRELAEILRRVISGVG